MNLLSTAIEIRRATLADVDALLLLKRQLAMRVDGGTSSRGGFLLGTDEAGYRLVVAHGRVWLLVVEGEPVGFSTAYPDPMLRASDLWARREQVAWTDFDPGAVAREPVAYLDQLGVLPGSRRRFFGAALGLRALLDLLAEHPNVLTTTVHAPIRNAAALAYIQRLGGRQVGEIDEVYPQVGAIRSGIYHFERSTVRDQLERVMRGASPAMRRLLELGTSDPT